MGVFIPIGFSQAVIPISLTGDTERMVVTVGFEDVADQLPNAQAQVIQDALFSASILSASSFGVQHTIGPVEVTHMTSLGPQFGIATGSRTGTLTDFQTLVQNTCVLVQKRTLRGGRKGRGRMYWPVFFPNEASVDHSGTIVGTAVTAWQTAMTNWLSGCDSNGCPLVLLHSTQENGDPPTEAPDPITSLSVQARVATQRGRLRR
jgi:hypothetical protein